MKLKYNFFAQTAIQILIQNSTKSREIYSLPGISFNEIDPLDSDISIEYMHHLILFYKEKMQSQHCGLEIIQHLDFQNADFFGPYAYSCPTLGEAIRNIFAVFKQLNPLLTFELTPVDNPSHFVYHLDKMWEAKYPESAREIMEFTIANGLISARSVTKQDIRPLKLRFKYDAPEDTSKYEEIFRCPVYFGKDSNSITYSSAILDYKIPSYNPTLLNIMKEFVRKTIQENEQKKDIVSKVKTIIMKAEDRSSPKEDEVADSLNMGKRTLQKRLKEKNG